jgi:hypothetical protein
MHPSYVPVDAVCMVFTSGGTDNLLDRLRRTFVRYSDTDGECEVGVGFCPRHILYRGVFCAALHSECIPLCDKRSVGGGTDGNPQTHDLGSGGPNPIFTRSAPDGTAHDGQ